MLQVSSHQRHQVGRDGELHGELEDPVLFGVRAPRRTHQNRHAVRNLQQKKKKKQRVTFLVPPGAAALPGRDSP